ncbi:MAG: hypothetical protein JWM27_546 [Gemmatimonadetes bacterium]|nr:hypothetical protein [Gemmatimonadota bacterium]
MRRPSAFPRLTRFCLVLAALLQLTGSAVGPWAHAVSVARAAEQGAERGGKKPAPPVHDERDCAVCQAFSATPVPAEAAPAPFVLHGNAPPLAFAASFHAEAAPVATRARAPPAAAA